MHYREAEILSLGTDGASCNARMGDYREEIVHVDDERAFEVPTAPSETQLVETGIKQSECWCLRGGSAVDRMYCSCRGPELVSQHSH